MIDGSLVQNLDITKISSMRRNRIISDIFNRLHLMERRGSGLTRIVESYNDSVIKPSFISDISSFKVIFPNKTYIKSPVLEQKSPVMSGNYVSDEDYFVIRLHKNLPGKVSKATSDNVQKLFDKFTYSYDFNREDVEEIFNVKKSRASEIISLLNDCKLIEPSQPTKYRFKK